MKTDLKNDIAKIIGVAHSAVNPNDDLRLAFLKSHYDAVARMEKVQGLVRNQAYEAYCAVDQSWRLAKAELEKIRDEVEARYAQIPGIDLPTMYHPRDCECDTCRDPWEAG